MNCVLWYFLTFFLFFMIRVIDDIHHDDATKNVIFFISCVLMFVLRSNLFISFFNKLTFFDFLMKRSRIIVSYVEFVINFIVVALMSLFKRKCMSIELISILNVFIEIALYVLVMIFSIWYWTLAKFLITSLLWSFFLIDVYHIEHAYVNCEMKIACIICFIFESFAFHVMSSKLRNVFIDFKIFVLFWLTYVFQLSFVFIMIFKNFIFLFTLIIWLNSRSRMNSITFVFFFRLKQIIWYLSDANFISCVNDHNTQHFSCALIMILKHFSKVWFFVIISISSTKSLAKCKTRIRNSIV